MRWWRAPRKFVLLALLLQRSAGALALIKDMIRCQFFDEELTHDCTCWACGRRARCPQAEPATLALVHLVPRRELRLHMKGKRKRNRFVIGHFADAAAKASSEASLLSSLAESGLGVPLAALNATCWERPALGVFPRADQAHAQPAAWLHAQWHAARPLPPPC